MDLQLPPTSPASSYLPVRRKKKKKIIIAPVFITPHIKAPSLFPDGRRCAPVTRLAVCSELILIDSGTVGPSSVLKGEGKKKKERKNLAERSLWRDRNRKMTKKQVCVDKFCLLLRVVRLSFFSLIESFSGTNAHAFLIFNVQM